MWSEPVAGGRFFGDSPLSSSPLELLRALGAAVDLPAAADALLRDAVTRLGCAWAAVATVGADGAPFFASAGVPGGPRDLPRVLLGASLRPAPYPLQAGLLVGGSPDWQELCPRTWCALAGPHGALVVAGSTEVPAAALEELGAIARLALTKARDAEACVRTQGLLDRLLRHVPALVLLTRGPEHVIEAANAALVERLALNPRQIQGKRVRDALPGFASHGFLPLCDRVYRSGQRFVGNELSVMPSPGARSGERWYNTVFEPLHDGRGHVDGLLMFCVDVTDQILARQKMERAEHERARLATRLARAHSLEAIGRLAGGVAHDFNNVLAVARGNLELAGHQAPAQSRLADRIAAAMTALDRAGDLTRQLSGIAGGPPAPDQATDLAAVVVELHGILRAGIPAKVDVTLDLPLTPTFVAGEWTQLQQVVLNLTLNAVEAMGGEGRLLLAVAEREVSADVADEVIGHEGFGPGRYTVLTVADTGCGMSSDVRLRIFDAYFTTRADGSGLGLANVLGTTRALGGGVRVRSAVGEGTTFEVFLPRRSPPAATKAEPPPTAEAPKPPRRRLLIIEDDDAVRELMEVAVEPLDLAVQHAGTAAEALAVLADEHARPAVIILDLSLPDLFGEALYQAISHAAPGIPLILCTGLGESQARRIAGGDADVRILPKPFLVPALLRAVSSALTEGTRAGGSAAPDTPTPPEPSARPKRGPDASRLSWPP